MVVYLWNLKSSDWCNSIVDLPEGADEMDEDLLLLWKLNAQFVKLFMTQSASARPRISPRKSTPTRDEKQTNAKLDFESCDEL